MSGRTSKDHWPTHAGDLAVYLLTPPTGYEVATDWRLQFRAAPLPAPGPALTLDVDESRLVEDPPIVTFTAPVGLIEAVHDGWEGDVQCSMGTLLTVTLKVEDDWTV